MAQRVANLILLVEDRAQDQFVRNFLGRIGHHPRQIRSLPLTQGRGSGEQSVRERYARQVDALRCSHTKACLVVMIDADTGSVDDRLRQFEGALKDADAAPRGAREPILNLIPKRSVETWILCLNSYPVDEATNYRGRPEAGARESKSAALVLFDWTRPNAVLPASAVSSLRAALPEFARLPMQ